MLEGIPEDSYIVRATEVGQFLNCPRNWMFASHNGFNLEPAVRPQKLRFGIVWHKGLECLYKGEDPFKGMEQEFDKEVELILGVAAYDPDIKQTVDEERELARVMMEGYLHWRNTCSPPDNELSILHTERRVLVPIEDTSAYLAVRFDAEAVYRGGVWVMEHKSRGKSSAVDNPPGLQLDIQMGLQLLASSLNNELPVRGALYNLARKQAPSKRVRSPLFGRHSVVRSKDELGRLMNTLKLTALDMMKSSALIETDPYSAMVSLRYNPQPLGLCAWGCSVKEICESINRGEDVEYLVKASLKPREKTIWEVLEEEFSNN